MENVVESYLEKMFLLEEIEPISEDVSSFLKKFKPEKLKGFTADLKSAVKTKNVEKISKVIKRVKPPTVPIDKLIQIGGKMSNDFRGNYKLAKRVLDNSFPTDVNDDIKKAAAFYLGVRSLQKKLDYKTTIRKFVELVRYMVKAVSKVVKEVPSSTLFEGVIGWIIIISMASLIITTFVFTGFWFGMTLLASAYVTIHLLKSDTEWVKSVQSTMSGIMTNRGTAYVRPIYEPGAGPELF